VQIIPSIAKWEEHPIDRLYRAGVSLSLNTDTRMLNPVTLTGEYLEMRRVFGWGEADFLRTNLMGVEAAFADDSVKERVRKRLTESYEAIVSNG
jgi:adenosine deaminase